MPVGEITRIAAMAGLKQPSGAEEAPRARFDALIVDFGDAMGSASRTNGRRDRAPISA